ncbi:hypothetical protein ACTAZI_18100 [Legionella bozemanae]|uniref:hypothetical protein n=1 Tax=Legionella bozemanae TaxID=447 RepID=UPI003EE95D28
MALSQKALQKKREKKKQSRKTKMKAMKPVSTTPSHITFSQWPLHECWVPIELWETGIGQVIVSRKGSLGAIAVGMYLLDVFCLGIKDCFVRLTDASGYKELLEQVNMFTGELKRVESSYASTLIYKAKEFAMQFGFKPHNDFLKAHWMLKNISMDETLLFTFGKNNKPFYMQGPNESPADVRRIMHTLKTNLGQKECNLLEI